MPNLRYKPKPEEIQGSNHLEGLSRHFDTQVLNYGKQVILNLVRLAFIFKSFKEKEAIRGGGAAAAV